MVQEILRINQHVEEADNPKYQEGVTRVQQLVDELREQQIYPDSLETIVEAPQLSEPPAEDLVPSSQLAKEFGLSRVMMARFIREGRFLVHKNPYDDRVKLISRSEFLEDIAAHQAEWNARGRRRKA